MFVNRRRTMRVTCDLMAAWIEPRIGSGSVLDMSADGLFVSGNHPCAVGERRVVALLVDHEAVILTIDIRFVGDTRRGHGCGGAIVDTPALQRDRWRREYRRRVDQAIARVPPSIGDYLRRRGTPG